MNSLIIAVGAGVLYLVAYHTYGKFLAHKIFKLTEKNICPSESKRDDVDFVPTKKQVLFGHHFTSIAGTGPIVGPAIAIIWGWLPALLWILFGSILMGAVHDFGALVISLRNHGRSVGDIAGDIISNRVKVLFLLIIFFSITIVIAVFSLIIGICFDMYPHAVWPVWLQIPIAVALGWLVYKKGFNAFWLGIIAVFIMYGTIVFGSYYPVKMPEFAIKTRAVETVHEAGKPAAAATVAATAPAASATPAAKIAREAAAAAADENFKWKVILTPTAAWVILMLIYVYIASTLPVQTLLQPRDYINSYQLIIAMGLLAIGVLWAHPVMVAPATRQISDGPPLIPTLFVVVACGAISGFHSLVSSGTSSKQCASEKDATFIGYGSMLIEGMLAVFVLIACGAGIGIGMDSAVAESAFNAHYSSWAAVSGGLGAKLSAFITGSRNLIASTGMPAGVAETLMGVFIVSFAATTLDSATRIQRYIVSELALMCKVPDLAKKHPATLIAVGAAFALAFSEGSGTGAMSLWPLFGSLNQLLGGLALLVITVYLAHKKVNIIYTVIPMIFMILMTGWAMFATVVQLYNQQKTLLVCIGVIIIFLEIWIIFETIITLYKVYFAPCKKQG